MAGLTLITDAAIEPVSLSEVKNRLRADASNDDDYDLSNLIVAARQRCEDYTRRAFVTQTWELAVDRPPQQHTKSGWYPWQQGGSYITLPKAPLQSIVTFTSYADNNTATVFPAQNYHVDTYTKPGRVVLGLGQVWPGYQSFLRTVNGIIIRYKVGYGDNASDVPERLRQAVVEEIRALYDGWDSPQPSPMAESLLRPYRVLVQLEP